MPEKKSFRTVLLAYFYRTKAGVLVRGECNSSAIGTAEQYNALPQRTEALPSPAPPRPYPGTRAGLCSNCVEWGFSEVPSHLCT